MNKKNNQHLKQNFSLIKEGSAEFYLYTLDHNKIPSKSMNVFYNKRMEINRDISNLAINAYNRLYDQKSLIIVDAMAASGVSAIRMMKECENIKRIYINDINPEAVKLININIEKNDLFEKDIEILVSQKDANLLLIETALKSFNNLNHENTRANVISIDPFGTPNLYLDSAFKSIQRKNGLICVTATDTAVLFGVRPDTCIRKYMSKPIHNTYCKEIGARILLYFISRIANINNLGIIPLLTFYTDHFIRIFALTFKDKEKITICIKNYGYLLHCYNCGHRVIFRDLISLKSVKCSLCGNNKKLDYAGPIWLDKIHNNSFVKELLKINEDFEFTKKKKIHKLLSISLNEIDMPISYYNIHELCRNLKIPFVPKVNDVMKLIKNRGYNVSRTVFDFLSFKTDMNINDIKTCFTELLTK